MSSNSNRRFEEQDSNNNNSVDTEVKRLLKDGFRGKLSSSKLIELRKKYNDDNLLDKIQEVFYDRLREIKDRARKFVKLIEKKFGAKGLPLHIVLKESKKYKEKYSLSEIEFDEFKKQYEKIQNARITYDDRDELKPSTNMEILFGDINVNEGLILKDADYPVVDEIVKLYTMSRPTHSSVILQSMQYENLPKTLLSIRTDSNDNRTCCIHPLIAAMFLPKIKLFEQHFLHTNIAYIVKARYNKEPLNNLSDIHLLYHMINDANDVVCSAETPLKDILTRVNLQNNLWNNVISLRNGKYYDCVGNDFFAAIDSCKISVYDTPDLLYTGDEGIILKRLLAAFSFRPIVMSTNPIFGTFGTANPINFPVISNRIVTMPLLTLRLPSNQYNKNTTPISLTDSISQSQVFLEGGMFVPKIQEVIYTNGVIIFHVPRRTSVPTNNYKNLINPIPQYDQIPAHILRNERVNDTPIDAMSLDTINIQNDKYYLRSAVILETYNENGMNTLVNNGIEQIVINTAAILRKTDNPVTADYYYYSPKSIMTDKSEPVISLLPLNSNISDDPIDLLSLRATIYIFSDSFNS
jgi:hypothetical protein